MRASTDRLTRRPSKIIPGLGRGIILAVWGASLALLTAIGAEFVLRARSRVPEDVSPFGRLASAYEPFTIQHINPHYMLFFPYDLDQRAAQNNGVVSVDTNGFRGPGPEYAGDRKLAFLLGGSAAFGHYASADSTTITGYLNRLQDDLFFVNAGVLGWNSSQELSRLVHQLVEFDPAVIIAYDGVNDISIAASYTIQEIDYPPGTPAGFDRLYSLVGDVSAGASIRPPRPPLFERLFPRLSATLRRRMVGRTESSESRPVPDDLIRQVAEKYLLNLTVMDAVVKANGARFIGIFQPCRLLHENVPAEPNAADLGFYRRFRDIVTAEAPRALEYHDFSDLFDRFFSPIQTFDPDGSAGPTNETIFMDHVHLYDPGNELVAKQILEIIF